MDDNLLLIKIGGGDQINLAAIADDLAELSVPIIIVHGANGLRDRLSKQLGYKRNTLKSLSGYSSVYSDNDLIDLQMMAYSGVRNKRIVELLQTRGINAIGLSGLDGQLIRGRRNRGIKIREGEKKKLIRDLSGKAEAINTGLLATLLEMGMAPVLTIPILDEQGIAINSENDDIVALLQKSMNIRTVIHLIESGGFLRDPEDPNSIVPNMDQSTLIRWEAEADGRIKRKLHSLKGMIEQGVEKIVIADGRGENPVRDALDGRGTVIE